MNREITAAAAPTGAREIGTCLVFGLGSTEYAVEAARVREIVALLPITRVPQLPEAIRGIINLRGKALPVVDLRLRFGLDAVDHPRRTCIIVLQAAGAEFGVVVDSAVELASFPAGSIEDVPDFGAAVDTEYLLGLARQGERVRLLLDVDRALSRHEQAALATAAALPA